MTWRNNVLHGRCFESFNDGTRVPGLTSHPLSRGFDWLMSVASLGTVVEEGSGGGVFSPRALSLSLAPQLPLGLQTPYPLLRETKRLPFPVGTFVFVGFFLERSLLDNAVFPGNGSRRVQSSVCSQLNTSEVRIDIVFCEMTSRKGHQLTKNILARYVSLGGVFTRCRGRHPCFDRADQKNVDGQPPSPVFQFLLERELSE